MTTKTLACARIVFSFTLLPRLVAGQVEGASGNSRSASHARPSPGGADASATTPPKLLQFEPLALPPETLSKWDGSVVLLELFIDVQGNVTTATVVDSVDDAVDEAAVGAALKFRFQPAEVGGEPAAVRIKYRYRIAVEHPQVAADEGQFGGVVRDKTTGAPLANVHLELDGEAFTSTDAAGKFTFGGVKPGAHTVTLSDSRFVPMGTQEFVEPKTAHTVVYEVEIVEEHVRPEEQSDLEIVVRSSVSARQYPS